MRSGVVESVRFRLGIPPTTGLVWPLLAVCSLVSLEGLDEELEDGEGSCSVVAERVVVLSISCQPFRNGAKLSLLVVA